ncbi:MAG: RIP metalloprotease RseP, partial [Bacteroidota bacterium]|nr:RIP metalloprotease RseP [Bacteroidota bacterium]
QPWEFRSKPAWQRLIIMLAGVTMNVLLAFLIYAMTLFTWGETKLPMASVKDGIMITDSLMHDIGLRNGDQVLAVNGEPVKYFEDLPSRILLGKQITISRDGKDSTINLPPNLIEKLVESKNRKSTLVSPRLPVIVGALDDSVSANAIKAGLKLYDRIVAVDSTPVTYFDQMAPLLQVRKGDSVSLTVMRDHKPVHLRTLLDTAGKIGFLEISLQQADSLGIMKMQNLKYGFLAAFPAGVKKAGQKLDNYIQQFKMMLNPSTGAYKALGGFKTIASIFPSTGWDWEAFWNITAFLSIMLAFMNLLPIPALDGGHVLFTLYEMISGRKPSDKFLEYAQIAGMVFLLALMLFANGNDWFGWGRGH